ncbi:phosphatidylserine decarboxylase family protein [Rhizoctonia solani]|uniref:Phosphatidylserine decarboxylase family protein n=3 Tax=Rhizoctonia solani TaxID=456999 RepID=A0A8H8PAE9_9AGAM|nr:phosphatidylserine decarboxylase family protein [Rhizoctonia solani]QRW26708.1 phosphatidylserine decarboxylase family protein [Rhizoctonia solani]
MALNLRRYNGWIPSRKAYDAYFSDLVRGATTRSRALSTHTPPVKEFEQAIRADPAMVKLFDDVFLQAPELPSQIPDFDHFLHILDLIVGEPPKFKVVEEGGFSEPIGVPMYILFDLLSNTAAAYDLFRMKAFNQALKKLLCSWGEYLLTDDSGKTLTNKPDGWFSDAAMTILEEGRGKFNDTYVILDENAVNRGYKSWDAFFTRGIKPEKRPVIPPAEGKPVIYNACESTVERYKFHVKKHDKFWLKGTMDYSLCDIFDGDKETAELFVGGTVYQAFLSPQDYHRWHSPVKGTVKQARIVDGTYYAVLPDEGENGDPRGTLIRSQPWLTVAATRAIITIEADDPKIGLVAFIGIGMAEVSTCQLSIGAGDSVAPGKEIGMFHFGGSSHALIFGPKTKITFSDEVKPGQHLHVNRIIAAVDQ